MCDIVKDMSSVIPLRSEEISQHNLNKRKLDAAKFLIGAS